MSLALASVSAAAISGGAEAPATGKGGGKKPRMLVAKADPRTVAEPR